MKRPEYYIESIKFPDDGNDIGKAVISCSEHGECVIVLGDRKALTPRLLDVLKGLQGAYA
jgi:hypothetical protein